MAIVTSYDKESGRLAEHVLLPDYAKLSEAQYRDCVRSLARAIQQAVEDWLATHPMPAARTIVSSNPDLQKRTTAAQRLADLGGQFPITNPPRRRRPTQ
jgi:hypothetical protein